MLLRFSKMHGLGNDFMVVDLVTQKASLRPGRIAQWSDRNVGIGFDQLLVVEPPTRPDVDFKYRIFNADGSEVEQCGNGARCFARFVVEQKLTSKSVLDVETCSGVIRLHCLPNKMVKVDMGAPIFDPKDIPCSANQLQSRYQASVEGTAFELGVVSMGNPHGVLMVDDVDKAPVATLGPALAHHKLFPNQANIGFMEVCADTHIKLRVFERGVGETLACGTGACAAMVVAHQQGLVADQTTVTLPGGDLVIEWSGEGNVTMTGPAERVFDGRIQA